jgi:hypothetical protein
VNDKTKRKPAYYTVDFVTALPPEACGERLERGVALPVRGVGSSLAPLTQRTLIRENNTFIVERAFPGAIHPIRLIGHLDPEHDGDGTWVHGAITHDTANQVWIEGLIVFVTFFLLTVLLFFRLRMRVFVISVPMLVTMLIVFSLRWRALRRGTEELSYWLRRRLYLTPDQVRAMR